MGNNSHTSRLPPIEWEKIDTDNGIEIYRNKANKQLAQKRIIALNQEYDNEEELEIYNMRQQNNDALVRVLGTQNLYESIKPNLICSAQKKIFVYTEKMPHRLSECPQLTFPQCLLFLRESLKAFQRIYKDYGPVQVTKQMIGINYMGEIKSWLNENWALNHRGHQYSNLGSEKLQDLSRSQYLSYRSEYMNEQEMVRNIIYVVEQKCQEGRFPQAFKQEVENQSSSFRKLLLYLKDFIEFNDIFLPEKIVYDQLIQIHYLKRFQRQMSNHLSTKNAPSKGNNIQGQHLPSSLNQLNGDLTKYMYENTQQNQLSSPFKRLKSSQLNNSQLNNSQLNKQNTFEHETNYQMPQSDALIFNEPHRTYSTMTTNQWVTKQQPTPTSSFYQLNTINTNIQPHSKKISKYQFNTSHYQPQGYIIGNDKESLHPITIESSSQPLKYGSYFSSQGQNYSFPTNNYQRQPTNLAHNNSLTNNYIGQPANKHLPQSNQYYTNYSNFGNTSNYHLIPSSGHQPTLGPVTTGTTQSILSSVKKQTLISNIQSRVQTAIQNKIPLKYQNFNTITDKPIQIGNLPKQKLLQQIKPITAQNSQSQSYHQNPQIYGYPNVYQNNSTQPITSKQTFTPSNFIHESHQLSNPSHYSQSQSSQTFSTFSFGSILSQNALLSNAYVGTGYSNTLTKYEPSNNLSKNVGLEGKYVEEFRSLLSPSLQHNIKIQNNIQNSHESKNTNTALGQEIIDTKEQSDGTFYYIKEKFYDELKNEGLRQDKQNVQGDKLILTELNRIVERTSNEVSESILRQF